MGLYRTCVGQGMDAWAWTLVAVVAMGAGCGTTAVTQERMTESTTDPMSLDTSVTLDDDDDAPVDDDTPPPDDDSSADSSDTDPPPTSTTSATGDESGSGDDTGTGDTGTSTTTGGDALWCADENLVGALPIEHDGNNIGASNMLMGSCTDGVNGDEVTFSWTAPSDGTFYMDTIGSEIDTVLYVLDECGGFELACDDDISESTLTSSLTVDLLQGETVLIVVDGYDGEANGNFSLYIADAI